MTNFQARIKPEYQKRFPQLKSWVWYDVDPLWPASKTRGLDLFGHRVTRLVTGGDHTSLRAGYLDFRHHPKRATATA
ncbi:MAG: hypothetical protein V3R71_06665 [Gemmatimonadales bacterium]